jgi:uncharacterized membrane protein YedE/YeeE
MMMDWITAPWPWYVAGPLIALVMFMMLFFGKRFGVSSTMRTICSIGGGAKYSDFFNFNWKTQVWNLIFVFGALIGGFIANTFMTADTAIELSSSTKQALIDLGMDDPGQNYVPDIFSWDNLFTLQGLIFMIGGGFLVGFGTRYAGGCTSGHAISGLSDLQLPSLIAVVGFFIGGLIVTHLIIPFLI